MNSWAETKWGKSGPPGGNPCILGHAALLSIQQKRPHCKVVLLHLNPAEHIILVLIHVFQLYISIFSSHYPHSRSITHRRQCRKCTGKCHEKSFLCIILKQWVSDHIIHCFQQGPHYYLYRAQWGPHYPQLLPMSTTLWSTTPNEDHINHYRSQ